MLVGGKSLPAILRLAGAAFGLVALALSNGAKAETLDEALIRAYLENPRLLSGRAELRAADELVPQALAGYRPTVSVDSSLSSVTGQTSLVRYR